MGCDEILRFAQDDGVAQDEGGCDEILRFAQDDGGGSG